MRVEGQTIVLEERWAEGNLQRLPDLAAELSGKWLELLKEAVAEGGLLAYGPDIASLWRRAAGRPPDGAADNLQAGH